MTSSLIALANLAHLDVRRYTVRPSTNGWQASVTAGYSDGQCPCFAGSGDTKDAALEKAARNALYYWTESRAGVAK